MDKTQNNITNNIPNSSDLDLMLSMLNNFTSTTKDIINKKGEVSILNFGSGDLKMTKALLGNSKGKINFSCYDPAYSDSKKLEEHKTTSRLSMIEKAENGITLDYLKDKSELGNKKIDLLVSNFCFHHFLETDIEENLKKEIQSINPEIIIISEYNMDNSINEESFKKLFTNTQERMEIEEYKEDWKKLREIHCMYDIKYYIKLLESIGYKIEDKENLQKSSNKFYLIAKRLTK